MAWVYLIIAGVLEIVWAFTLKQSDGFTKLVPATVTLGAMTASLVFLALAMKSMPLGTAYAVWTGIGAVGAFAVGVLVLGEAADAMRIGAVSLIFAGIVLMKLA